MGLIRVVWPNKLQLWCAKKGILTGRWKQAEIDEINARAKRRAEEYRQFYD